MIWFHVEVIFVNHNKNLGGAKIFIAHVMTLSTTQKRFWKPIES
jgi:hypothetical protein